MMPASDASKGEPAKEQDPIPSASLPLLSLYPNLRQTGWAVFVFPCREGTMAPFLASSGIVGSSTRSKMHPRERISNQLQCLTSVAMQWRPRGVVCSWAGGMNWGVAGMHLFEEDLIRWAGNLALPVANYPAPRVRASLAGKPNASKDALAYSVMVRLNLIGEYRSAPEWEAIAAGYHHLQDRPNEDIQPNSSC